MYPVLTLNQSRIHYGKNTTGRVIKLSSKMMNERSGLNGWTGMKTLWKKIMNCGAELSQVI